VFCIFLISLGIPKNVVLVDVAINELSVKKSSPWTNIAIVDVLSLINIEPDTAGTVRIRPGDNTIKYSVAIRGLIPSSPVTLLKVRNILRIVSKGSPLKSDTFTIICSAIKYRTA